MCRTREKETCSHFGSNIRAQKFSLHLDSLPDQDFCLQPRVHRREVCPDLLSNKPCRNWTHGVPCTAKWHPEFLQILVDGGSKWIWLPRQIICRTHQRAMGNKQHRYTCTDPNCVRTHAPNWLYAELYGFRWYIEHEVITGLSTGYTLDGDVMAVSSNTATLTLATMPFMEEDFYHAFRWHSPIPAPEPNGNMMVTAKSFRPNLTDQPRPRELTPRRHTSPRRHRTPSRHRSTATQGARPRASTPPRNYEWQNQTPTMEDPWTQAEREQAEREPEEQLTTTNPSTSGTRTTSPISLFATSHCPTEAPPNTEHTHAGCH